LTARRLPLLCEKVLLLLPPPPPLLLPVSVSVAMSVSVLVLEHGQTTCVRVRDPISTKVHFRVHMS
jgi:hypothetical protein